MTKVITDGLGMKKRECLAIISKARNVGGRNPYRKGTHRWAVWATTVRHPNATAKQLYAAFVKAGVNVNEKGTWCGGRIDPADSVRVRWDRERQRKRDSGSQD